MSRYINENKNSFLNSKAAKYNHESCIFLVLGNDPFHNPRHSCLAMPIFIYLFIYRKWIDRIAYVHLFSFHFEYNSYLEHGETAGSFIYSLDTTPQNKHL